LKRAKQLTLQAQIKKKVLQAAITICSGLLNPTGWAALPSEDISQRFFTRAEKPPKVITQRLFLMNMTIGRRISEFELCIVSLITFDF
jgi:hypothetical protein